MKKIILICLIALLTFNVNAQTGPGGIGNSDGTSGQPKNVLWLDASTLGYADGADLATWTDLSGNSNDLTQSNALYTPIFQDDAGNINGHPRAEFSKADNRIIINPFSDIPTSGITTFIIYKTSDSGDGLVSYNTATRDNAFLLYDNSSLTTYLNGGNNNSGYAFNSGSWQIMSHKWKSSGGDLIINHNGDQVHTATLQNGVSIPTGGCLAIGGEQDAVDGGYTPGQAFQGDIAEIIMYNSFLNSAQRILVENYLSEKYNLTFTTGTNDKYTGNDAAYIYNIAGIGQEADGDHTQTTSGGLYIYEWNSSLANGEYVMLGHDNTTNNSTTTYTGGDLPIGTEASWARQWYVEKTSTDGIDVKLIFDFKEGLTDGQYPANVANYVLLYRAGTTGNYSKVTVAGQGTVDADQVYFNISDANLSDGYYTIGTDDQTNSPVEGVAGRTWYALASGDWDTWDYWTLDPSGALPNNPDHETPAAIDKVVIHTGKTITIPTDTKTVASITVDGILQLGTTSGHNFTEIKGSGRIRLASDNFPLGDATHFTTAGQGEGTVVWQGGSYNLSTAHTFFKMEVDLDNAANTITMLADYTINGDFVVEIGIFQINDNAATTNLNIEVQGDVTIEATGQILTGNGANSGARHQFDMYGNFTNNGTVKFTNRAAPNYTAEATDGIVDVNFLSDNSNQTILCNGITNFYRIEIDKGTDMTYELAIEATVVANFKLYGYANEAHASTSQLASNANALALIKGTVRIKSNVEIPHLNNNGNYNISEAARLWVDGGTVTTSVPSNAIVPYGVAQISAGTFEALVPQGFTLRENGSVVVNGGTLNANQIRTSVLGASHIGSYIQSGGTVNIVNPGNCNTNYYHFSMTYSGNVFNMSGGTLHVYDANGTATNQGGIFIASDPANVNVTGGTVIAEIAGTNNAFKITSKASFYNLILRNTHDATTDHILDAGTNINGTAAADLAAQPLVVLNDLTIEDDCFLDHNSEDITIGRNFTIAQNSQIQVVGGTNNYGLHYNVGEPNTLTFNGSENGTFYQGYNVDDGYELYVWNLTVNKTGGSQILIQGNTNKEPPNSSQYFNRIINVQGTIDVQNGTLNQGRQSIRLYGPVKVSSTGILGIYEAGVTDTTAYIMLKDSDTELQTEDGAELGNFKLNPAGANVVSLGSNVHIKRIGYHRGLLNLKTYKLKVDYLHLNATTTNYGIGNGSTTEMIYSDANASDGGIEIYIPAGTADNTLFALPLGTKTSSTRYTPARIDISNVTDDGYIQIRPVDGELKTTNLAGGDLLDYYWRVSHSDFTTLPDVDYQFRYAQSDVVGVEGNYVPGKVLDEDPFTRSTPAGSINTGNNRINFNATTLENANYTAGEAARFTGSVQVYYSCKWNGWTGNQWSDNSVWSTVSHESIVNTGTYPQVGDIARVGYDTKGTNGGSGGDYHSILMDVEVDIAALIFDGDGTTWNPRVYVQETQTQTFNMISGRGGFVERVSPTNIPTVNADFGDFTNNNDAYFYYHCRANGTTTLPTHEVYPNIRIEGNTGAGVGNRILVFPVDIEVKRDMIIDGGATIRTDDDADGDIIVNRNFYVGGYRDGAFEFSTSGTARTLTVKGNITIRDGQAQSPNNILTVLNTTPSNLEHKIILYDDLINREGTIDLFTDNTGGNNVILELQDEQDASYTYVAGNTPDFYRIVMNKGTLQTNSFTFSDDFTLNGVTSGAGVSKALELQNGTLILDDTNIDIDLTTGDDDFEIPGTACLEVKQGEVNVSGDDSGISLDGKLFISGGIVDMDDVANNGNNYIEYSASGNATIEITSGTLTVGSQIRRGLGSSAGILNYNQSGGTVIIGKNAAPEGNRGVFEILNAGSSFTHSGGDLYIVSQQTNPTFATLYLDPETSSLTAGTTITLGNASTPASQELGIYSTINLQNLTLDNTSTNNPKAKMWIIPLSMDGELTIQSGTEFKANGLDLNLYGDFTNSGTFTANQNTTYFKGSSNQQIDGNTTFYNLTNQNTTNLNLVAANTDITIENILTNESGSTINDNSNDISVYGNIDMSGTHVYGCVGDGITLNGTSQQVMTGSGTFGKLTINNANGIDVPVGNELTINDYLKLESGVLNIGGNLLTLGSNCLIQEANPFGANNMIQTNVSFTDNGVKKTFPSGALNFIYPLGSGGKYTPVEIITTTNTATGAYIIAKGADEFHPSIQEDSEAPDPEITDADNVLQYYWVVTANGFTDLSATVEMGYDPDDVKVEDPPYDVYDYITARLLNDGTGNWLKYDDVSKFDEINEKLIFDLSNAVDLDITGDYTAGVDGSSFNGAIPDQVPLYASNGTSALLDWHTASTWRVDDGSGGAWVLPATMGLPDIPRGARVRILEDDTVQTLVNYISAYTSEINGTLDVNTTFGNRVGVVSGTGTLYTERGSLPAGFYETFFSATGGTIEFGGSTNYSVLSNITQVNNIKFSGTGDRELPNLDLTVLGDFTIDGTDNTLNVINEFDKKVEVRGNVVFNAGTFDAGTGAGAIVEFNGTAGAQTISGTGSFTVGNAFNHVIMNNTNGLTLSRPVEIDGNLTFTSGIITTSLANILTVDNSAETTAVTGYSSSNYVDGPMRKLINNVDNFIFPVGDASRYGRVEVINTATTGVQYWEAQYYDANPHASMDTSLREAGLEMVSGNEYWRIKNVNSDSSHVKIRWDDQSLLPAMTSDRAANMKMVEWSGALWEIVDGTVSDVDVNNGTILSDHRVDLDEHYFTLGTTESAPLPTAGFITLDTSICAGTSADLRVQLGGSPNWTIYVWDGSSTTTYSAIASSPYSFNVSPAVNTTYRIDSVSDNTGVTTDATIFGNPVIVTVVSLPVNTYTVTGGGAYCAGGSGVVVGLDGSETGVTYELLVDGIPAGSTVAGSGGAISFGNQTTAGNYTVEAAKDANTNCTETMTGSVNVTMNPLPTAILTVDVTLDTICNGSNTQIEIDFTNGTANFDFTISDGTNSENLVGIAADPYTYIPATAPVWVDDGTPDTDYYYSITTITDANGCTRTNIGNEKVTVFKVPETGPEYHISNDFAN